MNNPLTTSSDDSTAHLRLLRVRTLNEIAFLTGDRAHGGPAREADLATLRNTLRQLDGRIASASLQPSRTAE